MSTPSEAPGVPRLSVVIPTYDRPDRVVRLLGQLGAQTLPPDRFEVIVVDDGSREDPTPRILATRYPFHLVVERQPNGGAGAARHRGAEVARGEILLFLDDDMIPSPVLFEKHLAAHDASPRAVVDGCTRSSPRLGALSLFERYHARKMEEFSAAVRSDRRPRGGEVYSGNMSVRRADYFAVGGFDASLRRSEDIELGIRLEKAGVEVVYAGEAVTVHDSDHTDDEGGLRSAFLYGVAEQRIGRKHPDARDASPWRYLDIVSALPKPAFALVVAAPRAGRVATRAVMRLAEGLDALGLERAALAGTMLAYGMEYFRGVRTEAGSTAECARDIRRFRAAHPRPRRRGPRRGHTRRSERREALARFAAAVRADHEVLRRYDARYDTRGREPAPLARDLVERIGFQMMAGYRLMRLARESGSPLAAKGIARLMRHLYGADIHWDADIEPGVCINHGMGLAIAHSSRVGRGVILSHGVTIGDGIDPVTRAVGQPTLEEDVHVGPGATLAGPITIGARSKIMPGAVVTRSIPPDSVVEVAPVLVRPRKRRPPGEGRPS